MSNSTDAIISILRTTRGHRPYSMSNKEAEHCLNIALALAVELVASNDRIDRLERQLADCSGKSLVEVRLGGSSPGASEQRQESNEAMLRRVLRVLIDRRDAVDQRPRFRERT